MKVHRRSRRELEPQQSVRDREAFADLNWEDDIQRAHPARGRKPFNLTAKIEDYLRNYF